MVGQKLQSVSPYDRHSSSFSCALPPNGGFLSHGGTPSYHPFMSGIFHCKRRYPLGKPNPSPPSPGQCICPPLASTPSLDLETVLAAPGKAARSGKFECAMWVYCMHQHIWHIYQHIYQRIYVLMYMYMYIYIYQQLSTYIYICIYIYVHTHTHIHTYTRTDIHTYTQTHTHIHACMHVCIHTYIHSWTLTTFCTSVDSLSHALMGTLGAAAVVRRRASLCNRRESLCHRWIPRPVGGDPSPVMVGLWH